MAISEVSASADFTMDQTADTLINAMTLTPVSGDYLAVFTMDFDALASAALKTVEVSIYVGGAIVQHTERRVQIDDSFDATGARIMVCAHAQVTPNGSQAVEARYRISTSSVTAKKRTLTLFPNAAANFSQATGTVDATVNTAGDTLLTDMELTPGAGTYLLVFSASADNASAGSTTNRLHYTVYVNGAEIAHTERRSLVEASIAANAGCMACLIACKVTPTAGQVVDIRCRRDGAENFTVHERTLTLMKVDAANIKEATATADEADIGTADELLVGMMLTDPGRGKWLAIFSTSQTYGTIAANETAIYSIYNAGAQDADTERQMTHEESFDDADYFAYCHGALTVVGETDDVEVRWRGSSATSRTAHERTLVLVRDVSFPVVVASAVSSRATSVVDDDVTLPAGVAVGDLLLVFHHSDGALTRTFPGSWVEIKDASSSGDASTIGVAYLIAAGGETTVTVTKSIAERFSAIAIRILASSWHGTSAPEISSGATGSTANPDPDAVTASWGAENNLFIAAHNHNNAAGGISTTAYPTNYADNQIESPDVASAGRGAIASRELAASNDDPGTFTLSVSDAWWAGTIAVRPIGVAEAPTPVIVADYSGFPKPNIREAVLAGRF